MTLADESMDYLRSCSCHLRHSAWHIRWHVEATVCVLFRALVLGSVFTQVVQAALFPDWMQALIDGVEQAW